MLRKRFLMKIKSFIKCILCFFKWQITLQIGLCKQRKNARHSRILRTRSEISFFCREGTTDWITVVELFFLDEFRLAFNYLNNFSGQQVNIDLGANIGLFSLLSAHHNTAAIIYAYEPAPPNYVQYRKNISLNRHLNKRINLNQAAVGEKAGVMRLAYDESQPASANIYQKAKHYFDVNVLPFPAIICNFNGRNTFIKMDIEGSEYDLLLNTNKRDWLGIDAIALELHEDPLGRISKNDFLGKWLFLDFAQKVDHLFLICSNGISL